MASRCALWARVSKDEQERRFTARLEDPLRQWKLSPMDIESWNRWDDYTRARDEMFMATDTPTGYPVAAGSG